MTDSWGDGWNGNILAFKQGNVTKTFGQQMAPFNMRSYGPVVVTFDRFVTVQIAVYTLGQWTEEIGFEIRSITGALVFSRQPGWRFGALNILGSFCPDCISLSGAQLSS